MILAVNMASAGLPAGDREIPSAPAQTVSQSRVHHKISSLKAERTTRSENRNLESDQNLSGLEGGKISHQGYPGLKTPGDFPGFCGRDTGIRRSHIPFETPGIPGMGREEAGLIAPEHRSLARKAYHKNSNSSIICKAAITTFGWTVNRQKSGPVVHREIPVSGGTGVALSGMNRYSPLNSFLDFVIRNPWARTDGKMGYGLRSDVSNTNTPVITDGPLSLSSYQSVPIGKTIVPGNPVENGIFPGETGIDGEDRFSSGEYFSFSSQNITNCRATGTDQELTSRILEGQGTFSSRSSASKVEFRLYGISPYVLNGLGGLDKDTGTNQA